MEFNPKNNIVQLCVKGKAAEEKGSAEEAGALFLQAWQDAANDFEKFLAAHFMAGHQTNAAGKLEWHERALQYALKTNDDTVKGAYPSLYRNIARSYEDLGDLHNARKNYELATSLAGIVYEKGPFYHGTRADLHTGDLLTAGYLSNYSPELKMNHIYFTALISGAGLAATLAKGDGAERVYMVEPTGEF